MAARRRFAKKRTLPAHPLLSSAAAIWIDSLRALSGLDCLLGLCPLFSEKRRAIDWRLTAITLAGAFYRWVSGSRPPRIRRSPASRRR